MIDCTKQTLVASLARFVVFLGISSLTSLGGIDLPYIELV